MNIINKFNLGGQYTFPTNQLTKNLKRITASSRKRNPGLPSSDRPMYNPNRIINKASKGLRFANTYKAPEINSPNLPGLFISGSLLPSDNKPELKLTEESLLTSRFDSLDTILERLTGNVNRLQNLAGISLLQLIKEEDLPIKITSGLRPNSKTKSGKASYHSQVDAFGNPKAYDIQPYFNGKVDSSNEGFEKLTEILMSNPKVVLWFKDNGYGLLDETSKEMMQRTGATGPHFHIGLDQIALQGFNSLMKQYNIT